MIAELKTKFDSVMIIDDNETDIYIASHIVMMNNFAKKIFEYSSSQEALKYLQDNQENINALPEIIFLDIHMPVMNGFDFIEGYDKLSPVLKNHCKIYLVSSTNNELDIARIKADKNIVAFYEKPITKKNLADIS